jgi:hypothetical protein
MTDSTVVVDLQKVLKAREEAGQDLIELPSALGGIRVSDEVAGIYGDLEVIADFGFAGDLKRVVSIALAILMSGPVEYRDGTIHSPDDVLRDWIAGWLDVEAEEDRATA